MDSPVSSSDSNPDRTCFHCNSVATIFKRGWRLRNGGHAMLCNRCGTAYEDGSFCSIFHASLSGWRECLICDKPIHCGCIVSEKNHVIEDFGGVKCKVCSKFEDFVMKKPITSSSVAPKAKMVKFSKNPSLANLYQETTGQSSGPAGTKGCDPITVLESGWQFSPEP